MRGPSWFVALGLVVAIGYAGAAWGGQMGALVFLIVFLVALIVFHGWYRWRYGYWLGEEPMFGDWRYWRGRLYFWDGERWVDKLPCRPWLRDEFTAE